MSEQTSNVYLVGLLYKEEPSVDRERLLDGLVARIGRVEKMGDGDSLHLSFPDFPVTYAGGSQIPAQCLILVQDIKPKADTEPDQDIVQSWGWPEAEEIVPQCRFAVHANDFLSSGLPYKQRLDLFHKIVLAILDIAPCDAIHWTPSGQYVEPADYLASKTGTDADPVYPAINVRLYNINDGAPGEAIMDSVGFAALGGVDVQCHFTGLDPDDVGQMVGNAALYLFDNGDIINDGETIQGVGPGTRWICRHEEAIAPPKRAVIDINPGLKYAAGNRP